MKSVPRERCAEWNEATKLVLSWWAESHDELRRAEKEGRSIARDPPRPDEPPNACGLPSPLLLREARQADCGKIVNPNNACRVLVNQARRAGLRICGSREQLLPWRFDR